ncbi:MAG: hypothetical protein K2G19_08240, partial [Lachnospiraceae bacterium]|nr:hypothetical protein [Lachnospiraceae bacterium]
MGIFIPTCILYFVTIILLIQFNFISYLIPSREFWAFAFFFVILTALFLDLKIVSVSAGGIAVSVIISSVIKVGTILPDMDEAFIPELIIRVIYLRYQTNEEAG